MGAQEERRDARLQERYADAFRLGVQILERKGSKRLMALEAEEAYRDLEAVEQAWRLPGHFWELSCYGQRDALVKVARELGMTT